MLSLPTRSGAKPRTTAAAPHEQLDQNPSPTVYGLLKNRAFGYPHVERRPSAISVPGAEALWLEDGHAQGCVEAFMVGNEFAHVHPPHDGSMHLMLPEPDVGELLAKGWGEMHPMALLGRIPPHAVMLYAPRDADDVELVLRVIARSHEFATGACDKLGAKAG